MIKKDENYNWSKTKERKTIKINHDIIMIKSLRSQWNIKNRWFII